MRLWSLHPSLLDTKGLVACWREAKLALAVLENKTNGYKHHPQLSRFKQTEDPVLFLRMYLHGIYLESLTRNYNFNPDCISEQLATLTVTSQQLHYEHQHLLAKLSIRSPLSIKPIPPFPHPLFTVVEGPIEHWEKPSLPPVQNT